MSNLTIYDEKITRIKDVGGLNINLGIKSPLLKKEKISEQLYKIIPLFYYDDVNVNEGILEKNNGFFITNQNTFYFTSVFIVNHFNIVLTAVNFNDNAFLWITDKNANPFENAFIEIYGCDDGENFELIGNGRTDNAGQFIYQSDVRYIKFLYNGEFSDVVTI